jgi:hypothetical protein
MTTREPIKLRDIDNYLEDLTAIAETMSTALTLCLRARMAVSAGAQNAAYAHVAQVGSLLAKIYQAGDVGELNPAAACKRGRSDVLVKRTRR